MKTQSARPLLRRLSILLILALAWGTLASSSGAQSWSGCGEPYIKTYKTCWFWGVYCYETQQGCADCDQGTACFNLSQ
jgi:hypothetical protein